MEHARADLMVVRAAGLTDQGRVRQANEDAFFLADIGAQQPWSGPEPVVWSVGQHGILLAVSDGMGGAAAGEVASALSLEKLLEGMCATCNDGGNDVDRLRRVIEQASRQVRSAAKRPDRQGMGATLTAVFVRDRTAFIAEVGDSRAYLLRQGNICQVTHDQSYVQLLVDAGLMTPEEAEHSPRRNIVLQAMGQDKDVIVALGKLALLRGDRLLLCSDGLSGMLDDAQIRQLASAPIPVEQACEALVQAANAAGGKDNITVIIAEVEGPALPPADTGELCEAAVETVQEYKPS
jgi:serine/threonine protein phosphatase PrpC